MKNIKTGYGSDEWRTRLRFWCRDSFKWTDCTTVRLLRKPVQVVQIFLQHMSTGTSLPVGSFPPVLLAFYFFCQSAMSRKNIFQNYVVPARALFQGLETSSSRNYSEFLGIEYFQLATAHYFTYSWTFGRNEAKHTYMFCYMYTLLICQGIELSLMELDLTLLECVRYLLWQITRCW